MPRTSAAGPLAVLSVLTDAPTATADLYEQVGYVGLMRAGLIPYRAFKNALVELQAEGLAKSMRAEDESTVWWLTEKGAEVLARRRGDESLPSE
jgi:DNA-binding PadR family transcriptional regulator